jgi:sortase B
MRRILLFTLLLFTFSACNSSPASSPITGQPVRPPVSASESEPPRAADPPSEPPVPKAEPQPIPYDMQMASITPSRREQILEKKGENGDSVGWLTVPGTTIDNIVLQNPIGDNGYYTTHDFSGQLNKNGAYGMDWSFGLSGAATRDTFPRNTPIYAHNHDDDPNGILFAQLKKYKDLPMRKHIRTYSSRRRRRTWLGRFSPSTTRRSIFPTYSQAYTGVHSSRFWRRFTVPRFTTMNSKLRKATSF